MLYCLDDLVLRSPPWAQQTHDHTLLSSLDWLVGLVVKALRVADPGLDSHLCLGDFSWSSHPTRGYRVSTGTGWPNVSIL